MSDADRRGWPPPAEPQSQSQKPPRLPLDPDEYDQDRMLLEGHLIYQLGKVVDKLDTFFTILNGFLFIMFFPAAVFAFWAIWWLVVNWP